MYHIEVATKDRTLVVRGFGTLEGASRLAHDLFASPEIEQVTVLGERTIWSAIRPIQPKESKEESKEGR
jgi:hypothetical protein